MFVRTLRTLINWLIESLIRLRQQVGYMMIKGSSGVWFVCIISAIFFNCSFNICVRAKITFPEYNQTCYDQYYNYSSLFLKQDDICHVFNTYSTISSTDENSNNFDSSQSDEIIADNISYYNLTNENRIWKHINDSNEVSIADFEIDSFGIEMDYVDDSWDSISLNSTRIYEEILPNNNNFNTSTNDTNNFDSISFNHVRNNIKNADNTTNNNIDSQTYIENKILLERIERLERLLSSKGQPIFPTNKISPDDDESVLDSLINSLTNQISNINIIPTTDEQCSFNWTIIDCYPPCLCSFQPKLFDYSFDRMCRLNSNNNNIIDYDNDNQFIDISLPSFAILHANAFYNQN
eukprot:gene9926-13352_t